MGESKGGILAQNLFLVHIPKTAGTTVNKLIKEALGDENTATHIESRSNFLSTLDVDANSLKFISGHLRLPYVLDNIDTQHWFLFTILREPVQHLISHLKWVKALAFPDNARVFDNQSKTIQEVARRLGEISLNDVDKIGRLIREDFEEARQLFDNCQVRYLINYRKELIGPADMAAAIEALDCFNYVGLTERLSNACVILGDVILKEIDSSSMPILNQAKIKEEINLEDSIICNFYNEAVQWDVALYEAAKRKEECMFQMRIQPLKSSSDHNISKSRKVLICEDLDITGRGLEYGPLHKAILEKGLNDVIYVDFASKEVLMHAYASNPNVDTNLIPEIDIVTGGKLVSEFLPPKSVDYIIASHVAEHVPDLVGWLSANLTILRVGGRLSLAFPDKRYCFDIRRPASTVSDLIAAFLEKRTKPNATQICNHFYNVCHVNAADAWAGHVTAENAKYIHDRGKIFQILNELVSRQTYVDVHCWVFDPMNFLSALKEMQILLELPFRVVNFVETPKNWLEFFVTLERT